MHVHMHNKCSDFIIISISVCVSSNSAALGRPSLNDETPVMSYKVMVRCIHRFYFPHHYVRTTASP